MFFFTQIYKNYIYAKNCIYAKNYIPFFIYNVFYKHFSSHFFFLYMHKNLHTKKTINKFLYIHFSSMDISYIYSFSFMDVSYIYKFFYFFFLIYVLINIFLYIHYLINDSRHIQSFSLYAFL